MLLSLEPNCDLISLCNAFDQSKVHEVMLTACANAFQQACFIMFAFYSRLTAPNLHNTAMPGHAALSGMVTVRQVREMLWASRCSVPLT